MSKRRTPHKHTRDTIRAVKRAGGTVAYTSNGHLRITGPAGMAILPSDPGSWRGPRNNRAVLRKHAGLEI